LVFEREFQQSVVSFEFQFLADAGTVVFDGARAQKEFAGNLFVRLYSATSFSTRRSMGVSAANCGLSATNSAARRLRLSSKPVNAD